MKLPKFSTRTWIAIALYPMVMAVMYGVVAIGVLSLSQSEEYITAFMIPGIIAMVLLGIPVSWFIAPRLRSRKHRREAATHNDRESPAKQTLSEYRGQPIASGPTRRTWFS